MKEILKNLVESTTLPEDSYLEQDEEILEIFVEEIEEIFEELEPLLESWLANSTDTEVLKTIRRHFHTLKGSGRMVGARSAGEVAWAVEDLLNRILAGAIQPTTQIEQFVATVYKIYKFKLYPLFKNVQPTAIDLRPLVLIGQYLQQQLSLEPALEDVLQLANTLEDENSSTGLEIELQEAAVAGLNIENCEMVAPVSQEAAFEPIQDQDTIEAVDFLHEANEQVEKSVTTSESAIADIEQSTLLAETIEIFVEEAEEHLSVIRSFLSSENVTEKEYNNLIRALHTLRGSSTMVDLDHIFDASTKLEHLFKTLVEEGLDVTYQELSALLQYSEFIQNYLEQLKQSASRDNLQSIFDEFLENWNQFEFAGQHAEVSENTQGIVTKLMDLNIDRLLDAEFEFDQLANDQQYLRQLSAQAQLLVEGTQVKAAESIHHLSKELKAAYDALLEKPQLLNSDYAYDVFNIVHQKLIYLFDSLASSQRVTLSEDDLYALQNLSAFIQQDIESFATDFVEPQQKASLDLNVDAIGFADTDTSELTLEEPSLQIKESNTLEFETESTALETGESVEEKAQELSTLDTQSAPVQVTEQGSGFNLAQLSQRIASDRLAVDSELTNRDFDLDLLDIFLEEADELLGSIDQEVDTWTKDHENRTSLTNLMRYLHTLKGGANMISAKNIGLITHNLESIYERLINNQFEASPALISVIRLVQDDVSDRIQAIRDDAIDYPATETVNILQNIVAITQGQEVASTELIEAELQPVIEIETLQDRTETAVSVEINEIENTISFQSSETLSFDLPEELAPAENLQQEISNVDFTDSVKTERNAEEQSLHEIAEESFLEEAEELLETTESLIQQWIDDRSNRSVLLQLQRAVHSLKGGARMIELEPVAVISYQLENTLEQFAFHQFNSNAYDNLLFTTVAWLKQAIFKRDYTNFDGLNASLTAIEYVDVTAQLPERIAQVDLIDSTASFEFIQGDGTEPPAMLGEWDDVNQDDNSNEMIRISADLVEKMIDLSGENSINRSRIEMELGQFNGTLYEMEQAIQRLADQLRRMEGELESQILAKHGSENSRYEDFDPLEMDQYSSLNQLSKSLAESTSDLVDFKNTLADKIRGAEGLLLQQSRIQSEIQESLMRTRLVPFSRLLPRLQRIVRQTASSLNRPTELVVHNTEGELDRTTLERLVTPFEHMLRNAIDHGIENPEDRLIAKKPEVGVIELNISRQGTDVIVTFSDDGKGIDHNVIKAKALKQGLITEDQELDKQEILQFIFHSGFSTAKEVTQISGRGVGLDIVQSGIKALGGHVTVDSTLGKGTSFSIRVPTTVAVSDALMVKAGDQQFALPLAQIERIVRIAPAALETYFNSKDDYFKIDNESYKLRYISEFISNQPVPRLNNVGHSLPVILIKGSAGQTIGLLVDQLVGSRSQIVVKPIGQQFSKVGAIAGATIMGDGHVCLILDSQGIARQVQATKRQQVTTKQRDIQRNDARRLVMIVDDSVTVRKVTTRLLERQGYDVVTAKDGVDAVEQLENVKPDLMLLDIEMPRMDGFEVTSHVRDHGVHQDLPIIMITSRTGEKHRERAFSLGVNNYMGKPFQEAELLANIETLLAAKQG